MTKSLSIKEVEFLAHSLAKELMSWNEPIPDFHTRYPNKLESCLETPFQTFDGRDLYPGLYRKATMLFYLLNKNHPFENGNKRLAIASLLIFLYKNKKWIKLSPKALYEFAIGVAKSLPSQRKLVEKNITKFLKRHCINLTIHL